MNINQTLLAILAFGLSSSGLVAQQAVLPTGSEANGSGGSASYSVGQVAYLTHTGTNGSVAEGVQQPYEISVVIGVEQASIQLEVSAWPNPTRDFLNLSVDRTDPDMIYQVMDLHGRTLRNEPVVPNTRIDLGDLPAATYVLQVLDRQTVLKSFKIVKN